MKSAHRLQPHHDAHLRERSTFTRAASTYTTRETSAQLKSVSSSRDGSKHGPVVTKTETQAHSFTRLTRKLVAPSARANVSSPDHSRTAAKPTTPQTAIRRKPVSNASESSTSRPITDARTSALRHMPLDLAPPPAIRTPSLISGCSSLSTADSPPSTKLRRKPSSVAQLVAQSSATGSHSVSPAHHLHRLPKDPTSPLGDAVLDLSLPQMTNTRGGHSASLYTPVDQLMSTRASAEFRVWPNGLIDIAPSASALSHLTTPSSRFTESPFSHAPTPSSVSSCSSNLIVSAKPSIAQDSSSPRYSLFRKSTEVSDRRTSRPSLAPVRETSTSSTSSHTRHKVARGKSTHKDAELQQVASSPSSSRHRDQSPSPVAYNQTPPLRPICHPPELAHLNIDNPRRPSGGKSPPPLRPSRKGTQVLADLSATVAPVVRSDLPRLYTTYQKRQSSQELQTPVTPSMQPSRFGFSPRSSSHATHDSPRIDSAISPLSATSKIGMEDAKVDASAQRKPREKRVLKKESPVSVSSPTPGKTALRFGIFSRKSKDETIKESNASKVSERPKRPPSKGPVAGTGHEGYGRFGARPRLSSTSSNSSPDVLSSGVGGISTSLAKSQPKRRSSSASSSGEPELDDFLKARLTPVVLRGSASSMDSNSSSLQHSASELADLQRVESSTTSSVESYPAPRLLPSAMCEDELSISLELKPLESPRHEMGHDQIHQLPKIERSPSIIARSVDVSLLRNERSIADCEGLWLRPQQLPTPARPVYKWNFFQRVARAPQQNAQKTQDKDTSVEQVPRAQQVAHYAFIDPVDSVSLMDIEQVLQEDDSADDPAYSYRGHSLDYLMHDSADEYRATGHLSAASTEQLSQDTEVRRELSMPSQNHLLKHPRLSPVGRIPQVVSRRDRDRKLSDNSFSRPFARHQPHPNIRPPGVLYHSIQQLASPIEGSTQVLGSTPTSSGSESSGVGHTRNASSGPSSTDTSNTSAEAHKRAEFFVLSPRKDSDLSHTSSYVSWLASMQSQPPQEEDTWAEYNDLIDDMMPSRDSRTAALLGQGSHTEGSAELRSALSIVHPPPSIGLPLLPEFKSARAGMSLPQQIAHFLQPSLSPLTSPGLEHRFHLDRNSLDSSRDSRSSIFQHGLPPIGRQLSRVSLAGSQERNSLRRSRGSCHSRSASLPEVNVRSSFSSLGTNGQRKRETQLLDIAEDETYEKISAAGLRFGALMTSKWLSFGRVLFSPAHNEMQFAEQPRILVVDGLGSDWSYYVALSYPNATIYNLGPANVASSSSAMESTPAPPANHRQIPHAGIDSAFPFPRGFFTVVVFRFPLVNTETAYHACMFECKRVLRPGGHLEIAVLDLDLMGMGQKARRAVRNLKIDMQQNDCNVDLGNLSDTLVRLVGRRGFEEVQRCVVGVPVAGCIPESQENSISAESEGQKPRHARTRSRDYNFAHLLDTSRTSQFEPGKKNDEGITRMVANVGRWWYTTCYESALAENGGHSLWDDNALLRECEQLGTSFRLLICHAQKPMVVRRRTVSV